MDSNPDYCHARFEAARVRGEFTLSGLWLSYIAAGGHADLFDVDAHLHGVVPLAPFEQDVLAYALNERLDELFHASFVPYLTVAPEADPVEDLQTVIAALLSDDDVRPARAETER